MPAIIAALLQGLRLLISTRLGTWIVGALVWMGLGLFSTKVVLGPTINQLESFVGQLGSGDMGASALQWAGVLKFDVAITMVVSAYVTRHAVTATKLFLGKRTG